MCLSIHTVLAGYLSSILGVMSVKAEIWDNFEIS